VAVLEDPERYKWVLAGPKTELWVDTWAILASAANPEAAHAFINHVLDPEVSAQEIAFHGYNTAVLGTEEFLGDDLEGRDIIFFTPEQVATLEPGEVNEAQDRLVQIHDNFKAAAGLGE
jgi:spermidine/putrescine transport system substrate-binding protein